MTGDNAPEAAAGLDRLDVVVRAAPAGDTTAQIALWRQVTAPEHWSFIARTSDLGPRDRPTPSLCRGRRAGTDDLPLQQRRTGG